MKKALIVILALLVIIGGGVWYFTSFKMDEMIRKSIEQAGSQSLGTAVTVAAVNTDLKNGSLTIGKITVANPPGFNNINAFSLSGIEASVDYENYDIKHVVIDQPDILIEELNGETNFTKLLANIESTPAEPEPVEEGEEPPVITIRHFRMNETRAAFESKSMDRYTDLKVGAVELKNVKGTPSEVTETIMHKLVEKVISAAAVEMLKAKASEKMNDIFGNDKD